MAKRSPNEWNSELVQAKDEVTVIKEEPKPSKTLRLRLIRDVYLNIDGAVTSKPYHFNRGGSEVDVDYEDAILFLKKLGGGCENCPSSSGATPYFELVEV